MIRREGHKRVERATNLTGVCASLLETFTILADSSVAQRAGVNCSSNVLRHTAAVWMAEDGVPMQVIAQHMGYDDSRTTEHNYARFSPDYLRDAAASLEL